MKPEVAMQRRKFSQKFKLEAVKLVRERGVLAAQAARDLDVHENVLRKWIYNTTRRHSTIGYVSPVEFERKLGLA